MGRLFIEYVEDSKLNFLCHECNIVISDMKYLKNINIETVHGQCIGFTKLINITEIKNKCKGQMHKSELVYMYDDDCPLDGLYVSETFNVNCRSCNKHLGWKHKDTYIILKKLVFFLKIK